MVEQISMMAVRWFESAEAQSLCRRLVDDVGASIYVGPDYRVTLLSNKTSNDWLEPIYRYEGGKAGSVSGIHLQLRKGVPVAGRAWEHPMRAFILEMPEFKTIEDVLRFYIDEVGLPPEQAGALRSGTMTRYRSVLCVGLHQDERETPLVLSVDSVRPNAFVNQVGGDAYVKWGGKLVAEITRLSPQLRAILRGEKTA